jgi:hypothetical protein
MHLERFVHAHPDCIVGRPHALKLLAASASLAVACLGAVMLAFSSLDASSIETLVLYLSLAIASAALGSRLASRTRVALALWRRGHASYAIADDELILVDAVGNAVIVEIARVTRLELEDDEPRLRTDSEDQGKVYAAMFGLFDGDTPHPSGERFFEALAPKVRARCPRATVTRRNLDLCLER